MFKQLLAIILLSIAIILAMSYAETAVHGLVNLQHWVAKALTGIFSNDRAGELIRQLFALLVLPFALSFCIAIVYWLFKRSWFPHFMHYVWVLWLIQMAALMGGA